MTVADRRTGALVTEPQFGDTGLRLLYGWPGLLPLVNAVFAQRWFSSLLAWPATWRRSADRIPAFVAAHGVSLDDTEPRTYASFADFFTRAFRPGARPVDPDLRRLIAPADARLLVYPVTERLTVQAKGFTYTVADLLGRPVLAGDAPAWCLVFRLTVSDVHRYCFMDDCTVRDTVSVPGKLHTVGPWSAGRVRVLAENHRVVTRLTTRGFGDMTVIEVGAMLVGRIVNHPVREARRGQEKGFFAYGGSTIVVLTTAVPDADIVVWSARGIETRVRQGEGIATASEGGGDHDS